MSESLRLLRMVIITSVAPVLCSASYGQDKFADIRSDIPFGRALMPRQEEPIFAVCTKQGMRILVSRDDGQTWRQSFLGTDALEDGGWHGRFAVYGMAATNGVVGVFSGWGTPGVYIGSDDGRHWGHLAGQPQKLGSVWGAAAGNGILLTSADQWRGMTSAGGTFADWKVHRVGALLDGGKTHHMICGFGDYAGGRFVVAGDNHHVFFSDNNCETWQHSRIPETVGERQEAIAYGNGVFLVAFKDNVARSDDGGLTWTVHETGLQGRGLSWRGLSFVRGEFWLTSRGGKHGRRSADGIKWTDLASSAPGGRFVESETGTIINVERGRYDVKRSIDGKTWVSVFNAPAEDVSWDTAFAVYAKVNAVD